MRFSYSLAVVLMPSMITSVGAQSLAQQVTASSGTVQIIYPSRPRACGDGQSFISDVFGQSEYYSGNTTWSGQGSWSRRPCVHGPARVVVTVLGGEITRAHAYVGPIPPPGNDVRTLNASASDASAWMEDIISRGNARAASDLLLPLMLADGAEPWRLLIRVARDDTRPRDLRRNVMTWLSTGVSDHLGILDAHDNTDDDEMRTQAVYVLSQRPRSESIPQLIELAKSAPHASARRSAIYWLGQTGDSRAVDVYAELLGIR